MSTISTFQGFKSEWSTVKDDHLWIGGLGRNYKTTLAFSEGINVGTLYVQKKSLEQNKKTTQNLVSTVTI